MNNIRPIDLVFSIMVPKYSTEINFDAMVRNNKILLKSALKVAERNGLYYNFMTKLKELNVNLSSHEEKTRWEDELARLNHFQNTIELLNRSAIECGIDYVLIKACTKIPHIPRDVDIYIESQNQYALVKTLENNGMKCVHSDRVDTSLIKENHIKVDLYTGLCYFTVEFIDGNFLWDSITKECLFDKDYTGLKPEANFLVMLVHSLFGHSSMSLLDFLHMMFLLDEIIDINICRKYAYDKGWGRVFDLVMKELVTIREKIYEKKINIDFPYLFDRKFVLACVNEIDGLKMTNKTKIALYSSLIQDQIVFVLRDKPLYNILKSFNFTRNMINSFGYFIRNMRGDKRS